ncbi:MAG: hypothetical protein EP330_29850 [Deltaproteobacteria bacterium]|nr:MAG: hypothetical protein EP330_29850 [Deltaproteobacteria bacterium]
MGKLAVSPSQARTFALVGHRSSGKTSLAEALLAEAGVVRRPGLVEQGTTLLDHLPVERRRHMSLQAGFAWMPRDKNLLFLIDVPGGAAAAPERAITGAGGDLRLVVTGVTDGVEQGTRRELAQRQPAFIVLTKMDRAHQHEWPGVVAAVQDAASGKRVQPLQLPFYTGGCFTGVLDLVSRRLVTLDGERHEVPDEVRAEFAAAREALVESVALHDDSLLETYLEFFELDDALFEEGLARAVASGRLLPVCFASALTGIGAGPLLDAIARFGPAPIARPVALMDADGAPLVATEDGPFAAQVLATQLDADGEPFQVLRVWSGTLPARGGVAWDGGRRGLRRIYSLRGPRRKVADYVGPGAVLATWELLGVRPGDIVYADGRVVRARQPWLFRPAIERRVVTDSRQGERLYAALAALQRRDRGASVRADGAHAAIVGGVNSLHLQRMLEILAEDVRFETSLPMVPYREAPRGHGVAEFEHQKLVGGEPLEYARVVLEVRPSSESGLRFSVAADEEALPSRWHEAIERGVREAMSNGPSAGYPVDGLEVVCTDGDYDLFASEEAWFELAAAEALREALYVAKTELIEPLFEVTVDVPSERVGDVLTELGQRGGRVIGLESPGSRTRISAEMPYRQLRTLGPRLEAVTSGESRLEAAQRRMAPVPAQAVAQAMHESPHPVPQRRQQPKNSAGPAIALTPG